MGEYMINILRLKVKADWQNNILMRDCMTILIFIFICSFGSMISEIIISMINVSLSAFGAIIRIFIDGAPVDSTRADFSSTVFNDSIFQSLLYTMLFSIILFIPTFIVYKLKKIRWALPIMAILCIIFNCFQNINNVFFICIILIFLIPISWIIPIGSGKYFGLIEFLAYFLELHPIQINFEKLDIDLIAAFKYIMKIVLRIFVPAILCTYMLRRISSEIEIILAIEIYFGILFFAFLNYSEKVVSLAIRRMIIYMIIVFITVANIQNDRLDIFSIILNIFAILFALNRVLSAINDIKKDVENNSCLYVFEHKGGDLDWLIKNCIEYSIMKNTLPSENLFIRQISIHFLLDSDATQDMINTYKEYYEENIILVKQLEFMEIFSNKDSTLNAKISDYEKYFIKYKEMYKLASIPAYTMYCFLLVLDEQYDKCIELLSDFLMVLNDFSKYILYFAYTQTNKERNASMVKENMEKFDEAEKEFVSYINEYKYMKPDAGTFDDTVEL